MEYNIEFPKADKATQASLVASLESALKSLPGVEATDVKRANPASQDAGTILSIVLAGPAVLATVAALQAWLVRKNQGYVKITTPDGKTLVAGGLESADIPATARALTTAQPRT